MKLTYSTLAMMAAIAATPVFAQETPVEPAETPATEAPATETPAEESTSGTDDVLNMGEPVSAGSEVGQPYIKETHGDWEIRCIRTENNLDPCQLYQRIFQQIEGSDEKTPIAEMTVFPLLQQQGDAVAGGSISAPLETLLTEMVRFQIDSGEARRYPFRYCAQIGCYASMGFTAADISGLKGGNVARVAIVPVVAPDQQIVLEVSLTGFTAGYNALTKIMEDLAAEARALQEAQQPAETEN